MTHEVSLDRSKRITLAKVTLALLTVALSFLAQVGAQYGGSGGGGHGHAMQQYQYESGGGDGGGGYDYGMDERPKLNLGIRLRIPAFRFELPRFSLPKITVSAKIRQPDRPRVINLPEINLDTTSKVEPPGSKMAGGGGYGGSSSYGGGNSYGGSGGGDYKASSSNYQQPSYGYAEKEKSQTFTFSTAEETHPSSYGNNNYQQPRQQQQYSGYSKPQSPMQHAAANQQKQAGQYGGGMRPMQQQHHQQQHDGYRGGASMSRPVYTMYSQPPGGARFTQIVQNGQDVSSLAATVAKHPELGFNAPAYVDPETLPSTSEPGAVVAQ